MKAHGNCLCEAVKYSFKVREKHFDACHCSMCRKWSGGPVLAVESDGEIKIDGEENISVYNSSEWAERGFCKICGTNVFYRMKEKDLNYCNFMLGTLEGQESYKFVTQIYIDAKVKNYNFAEETKMMTQKEVLEAFGLS